MTARDAGSPAADLHASAFERWVWLMRHGAWEAAWRQRDKSLLEIGEDEWQRPRHLQRLWRGEPVAGRRVLIACQHGLGDTIQFVRYVPMVAQVARHVSLAVQPPLIPLVEDLPGVDRVLPMHDGPPDADVEADVIVEVMELAHLFRSTPDTMPASVPYLNVPAIVSGRSTARPRLGFAWRAGDWDPTRSLAPAEALAVVDDVPWDVVPLLPDPRPGEAALFDGGAGPGSIVSLAAMMMSLELVVTVDTLFAHLAGALGVPVWILLRADPDWRWMLERADSPWYPTARLFRQDEPGEWRRVIREVRSNLVRRGAGRPVEPAANERLPTRPEQPAPRQ
jgi:hypothetical protein